MVGKPKNRMAECHPERKHLAKGLCAACYQLQRAREQGVPAQSRRMAECHPDRRNRSKGLCNACCVAKYAREHRDDPDKPYLNAKRAEYFKRWYDKYPGRSHRRAAGITQERMEAMLAEQGGRCAICERDTPNGSGQWQVDHDHATGRIRGILCAPCNSGLGNFHDDPAALRAAIAYLRKWRA